MTTAVGLVQVAPESTCEQEVAPCKRAKRARGATEKKSPAALAAGNGHDEESAPGIVAAVVVAAEARPAKVRKPRRRYRRVAIGFPVEIAEGRVEKWGTVEGEDRWGNVTRRRVCLLDEDGFPTTGLTGWVGTGRWLSEPTVIKFPEDAPLPTLIRTASAREQRRHPNQCVGGFRLIYAQPPKPPQAKLEWFPASDKERRKAFLASLPEASPEIKAALATPSEPIPTPEQQQWFRVDVPQVGLEHGAWEEFPDCWCAKLVPQPEPDYGAIPDPNWTYVQLPYHFFVWYEDKEGRLSNRRKSDKAGNGRVECGMWIPRWLLASISGDEAAEIYDILAAQVAAEAD